MGEDDVYELERRAERSVEEIVTYFLDLCSLNAMMNRQCYKIIEVQVSWSKRLLLKREYILRMTTAELFTPNSGRHGIE